MAKKKNKDRLVIQFKDGREDTWKSKGYTDYYYDGKFFIIIRNKQWVGMYNLDTIEKIIYKD